MKENRKILIVIEEGPQFFYYKTLIKTLCERGYQVKILFAKREEGILEELGNEYLKKYPNLSWGKSFYRRGFSKLILHNTRPVLNYRRFLVLKDRPTFYAERLKKFLPPWLKPLVRFKFLNVNPLIRTKLAEKLLRSIEAKTKVDERIIAQLKEYNPDAVLIAAGNNLGTTSPDYDYVKAAKQLKIKHAFSVFSWDYLETKGVIHVEPEQMFVWNEAQKNEAVNFLGVSENKISILGAPQFDDWFQYTIESASKSRESFCAYWGLNSEKPIIAYLASAGIFGDETWFLDKVKDSLEDSNDEFLKEIQIIVRPHPKNNRIFKYYKRKGIILAPRHGALPIARDAMQLFYDTLYHASLVISIGTSGFLDAIIADKPCVTVLADEYHDIQKEAPHFKHLLRNEVVAVAKDFDNLLYIIKEILNGKDDYESRRDNFVKAFIRPKGLNISVGETISEALDDLMQ